MDAPARIGKYELEEFIGGGMSKVYRARDTVIGRTVAVKILTEAGANDPDVKARFLAEARMAGNVAHDNVLSIYDFGEDDQHRLFMVMEFLRGEDLAHAIKNGRTGDLKLKLKTALQVARALEYVHTLKIIHRDIKPDNIYIGPLGVVKLMDFGIAKSEGHSLTRAGMVVGTPSYMAPEQIMGQDVTEQVDVHAFGLVLFELLSGVKAVRADTMQGVMFAIVNQPVDVTPLKEAGVPRRLCDLVAKCAAKKPLDRPPGFTPIIAELERVIAELDNAPAASSPRRPAWMIPAAALGILLFLGALYFAVRPKGGGELAKILSTPTGLMVLVPAGDFQFGENKEHISLPAFYIDQTEVSNGMYARFCKETKHDLPLRFDREKAEYPVVNVTIGDARDFAKWAGKRLPNSREWEKAARGVDGRTYPWGDQLDNSRVNVGTNGVQPVHAFSDGASPYGALQMIGNVWELVDQPTAPSPRALERFKKILDPPPDANEAWYMIRGESFQERVVSPDIIWDSSSFPVRSKGLNIGFRCVKDAH